MNFFYLFGILTTVVIINIGIAVAMEDEYFWDNLVDEIIIFCLIGVVIWFFSFANGAK